MLWQCWLSGRKGIRPVKNWVVGCWRGHLSAARCSCIWPNWCHCQSLPLASVKSRLVWPFWYRFTWVVPDKGPLNRSVYSVGSTPLKSHNIPKSQSHAMSSTAMRSRDWHLGTKVSRPNLWSWHQSLRNETLAKWTWVHSSFKTLVTRS